MPSAKNISGKKFNRLTVVDFAGNGVRGSQSVRLWNCLCDCGNTIVLSYGAITQGSTKSCGCLLKESITKHGLYKHRVYKIWHAMIERCRNEKLSYYKDYGGRGIKVHEPWVKDFTCFLNDMGMPDENLTLDRIDVNGNYEPANCRWVSQRENANNRRNNLIIEYDGFSRTAAEWARCFGLNKSSFLYRFKNGWSMDKIKSLPPDRSRSIIIAKSRILREV